MAGIATNAGDEVAANTKIFQSMIPRVNFKFQSVPSYFDLGSTDYYQSIIMIGLFGLVPALFSLFCGIFFCAARMCGCCECLCGDSTPVEPNLAKRMVLRVIIGVSGIGIIVALIFGIVGSSGIGKSITIFADKVDAAGVSLLAQVSSVERGLETSANLFSSSDSSFQQSLSSWKAVNASFIDVVSTVHSSVDAVKGFEFTRVVIYGIVLGFILLVTLWGIWCAFKGHGKMACIAMPLTVVASVAMWIFFGVHLTVALVMGDFCSGATALAITSEARLPPLPQSVGIARYLPCFNDSATSALQPINALAFNLTSSLNASATDPANTAAFGIMTSNGTSSVFSFPLNPSPCFCPCNLIPGATNCASACASAYPFEASCIHSLVGGVAQNMSTCVQTLVQSLASTLVPANNVSQAEIAIGVTANQLLGVNNSRANLQLLKDCTYLNAALTDISSTVCTTAIANMGYLWVCSLACAILFIFFTIATIFGIKRFDIGEKQVDRAQLMRDERKAKIAAKKKGMAQKPPKNKQRDLYYDVRL